MNYELIKEIKYLIGNILNLVSGYLTDVILKYEMAYIFSIAMR